MGSLAIIRWTGFEMLIAPVTASCPMDNIDFGQVPEDRDHVYVQMVTWSSMTI